MKIHPDVSYEMTQGILQPFFGDKVLMYQMFLTMRQSGRLNEMDTSWLESDCAEAGDVEGMIENAVRQHVFGVLDDTAVLLADEED